MERLDPSNTIYDQFSFIDPNSLYISNSYLLQQGFYKSFSNVDRSWYVQKNINENI